MKKIKILALTLVCIMVLTVFTGCGGAGTENGPVTDMTGREIKLDSPADKVVALTASDCEIIYALGAGSTIVGRGEYCDYPKEVSDIPSVQSGSDTNIEQIIALKPQVVLMSAMAQTKEQITALENAGILVIVSDAQDIEGVYTAIELIGKVVGKNNEAKSLIAGMKKSFEDISKKVTDKSDKSDKTVYFEVSPLQYGLWTAGSGTFMDEIAAMVGLKNAFADVSGWGEISQEQVIVRNPDYIITVTMYSGEGVQPIDEIIARDGWSEIKAVKNAAVFDADSNEITRPGPRLVDAAEALYSFIYEK